MNRNACAAASAEAQREDELKEWDSTNNLILHLLKFNINKTLSQF